MVSLRVHRLNLALVNGGGDGVPYTLNRDAVPLFRKVKGEPGVDTSASRSHAAREALAALRIASNPAVEKVLIGEDAYDHLYGKPSSKGPRAGRGLRRRGKNCDVVGVLSGNRGVILGGQG